MTAASYRPFARLVVWCWLGVAWCGCGSPGGEPASPRTADAVDSVTVVLSKFYTSQNYRKWLGRIASEESMGPLRFVEAYGMEDNALLDALSDASAVVLTGGEDVHPGRYGQAADTVRCGRIDVERDRLEHLLLDVVMRRGIPCLGVCRGLQVMNVHGGGTLRPHLPDDGFDLHRGGTTGRTSDTLHPVAVIFPWQMEGADFPVGTGGDLVSHHHQGIGLLSREYVAWAQSPDGLIEGIRHVDTTRFPMLVGVQWHPERSEPGMALSDGLGQALLRASRRAH